MLFSAQSYDLLKFIYDISLGSCNDFCGLFYSCSNPIRSKFPFTAAGIRTRYVSAPWHIVKIYFKTTPKSLDMSLLPLWNKTKKETLFKDNLTTRTTHSPVWPDLAKIRHFGQILKAVGNFERVFLVFGKSLNNFGNFLNNFWQTFTGLKGQII